MRINSWVKKELDDWCNRMASIVVTEQEHATHLQSGNYSQEKICSPLASTPSILLKLPAPSASKVGPGRQNDG